MWASSKRAEILTTGTKEQGQTCRGRQTATVQPNRGNVASLRSVALLVALHVGRSARVGRATAKAELDSAVAVAF